MSEVLRERTPQSRGRVRCDDCGRTIPRGEQYRRSTFVECRDLWEWCECQPCQAAVGHVIEWEGTLSTEVYTADDFLTWAWESMRYASADHSLFQCSTTGMWAHYLQHLADAAALNAAIDADPAQAWDDNAWAAFTWRMQTSPAFNPTN